MKEITANIVGKLRTIALAKKESTLRHQVRLHDSQY